MQNFAKSTLVCIYVSDFSTDPPCLADRVSEKRNIDISKGRTWIRTKLCFSLLRSANLCIRGSRSRKQYSQEPLAETDITRAMVDSKLDKENNDE